MVGIDSSYRELQVYSINIYIHDELMQPIQIYKLWF